MLKHIVMWTLADQAEGKSKAANLAQAKTLLEGCADLVPGMRRLEVAGATPGLDCTCDLVLYSEFDDRAALGRSRVIPEIESSGQARALVDDRERGSVDHGAAQKNEAEDGADTQGYETVCEEDLATGHRL